MRGETGEKQKQGRTKQEVSKIDAETAVLETERQGEKACGQAHRTRNEHQPRQDFSDEPTSPKWLRPAGLLADATRPLMRRAHPPRISINYFLDNKLGFVSNLQRLF